MWVNKNKKVLTTERKKINGLVEVNVKEMQIVIKIKINQSFEHLV